MHLQGSSEIFVTYSDVAGGVSGIVGFDDIIYQNNIDQFPDFSDVDGENYSADHIPMHRRGEPECT